jgi:PAS domain S-box-containing protein
MKTVLVVEDDGIIALDIQETLTRLGYRVPVTVDCCEDALAAVDGVKPDIVLMDIQLHGALDGIATASQIRIRADIPVVYLTSHSDDATLARAKETGPYGYLVKPFNERDLRTAIEVAIRKRELERHVADRERWFSTTLESLGDAVIATDSAGHINFMNPVAEKITGFSSAEAKGRPLHEVFHLVDDAGAPIRGPANRAWRSQFAVALPTDVHLVDRSGASKLVDDNAAPIIDDRGALLGGVIVFRDITHQKRLERRLAISERMAAVGTMAAGLAHEVNNPLAAVVGNVTFAAEELRLVQTRLRSLPGAAALGPRVAEVMQALEDAVSSADRVQKIVHTMRWFARPHAASRQVVDLPDVIEPALRLTENTLRHKARLVRAYGTTPFVEVDDGQLLQVLTNLLANAADAIKDGSAEANEIRVTTSTDDRGRAVVAVRDTGVGIANADLARVFDPFFTTKGIGSGMGLGLSISHGFVTSMGGEMTVESAPGRGTEFKVALPAATRERTDAAPMPDTVAATTRRGRVLVLDDEAVVANAVRRVLREHDVVVETDGRAACARLERGERFDVIFCDLMMPNMSGAEVFEAIRTKDPAMAERMVFLTGGAFSPRATEFLESVANLTVAKPFRAETLRGIVRDYVK